MIGSTADAMAQASPRPLLVIPTTVESAAAAGSGEHRTGA
jgi:hypothetical protein